MIQGFFPLPHSPSNSMVLNASALECVSVCLSIFRIFFSSPISQVRWKGREQRWVSERSPLPPKLPLDSSPGTPPALPVIPWPLKKLEEQLLISFRERLGNEWGSQQHASIADSWFPSQAAAPVLAPSSLCNSSFSSSCQIFSGLFRFLP